jgi:Bacterial Ig-like domain (group 3)
MHQLARRLALGLTLPLAVGAPVVLVGGPAHASPSSLTIQVSSSADPSVYGQLVTATATVTNAGQPVTTGSVQFAIAAPEMTPVALGGPVAMSSSGTAVSPDLAQPDGHPLEITAVSGPWEISATYLDPIGMPNGSGSTSLIVNKAGSSIAVLPTSTTLVADLAGAPPGGVQASSIKPSGAVEFKVNGAVVGSNDIVNGRATLDYVLPSGPQTVTATFTGDSHYLGTSESSTRKDPLLEARVLSMFPKSKSGWYHTQVDLWFVCRPQGSELVEDCPADLSLKKSGKNQSVTRTVHAVDGGSATITVSGIDIDRDKPVITINGRSCSATDKLSGVKGRCKMTIASNGHVTAVAQDKAGNRAVKRGILDPH